MFLALFATMCEELRSLRLIWLYYREDWGVVSLRAGIPQFQAGHSKGYARIDRYTGAS